MKHSISIIIFLILKAGILFAETELSNEPPPGDIFSRKRASSHQQDLAGPHNITAQAPDTTPASTVAKEIPPETPELPPFFKKPETLFKEEPSTTKLGQGHHQIDLDNTPEIHEDAFKNNRVNYLLHKARIAVRAHQDEYAEHAYAEALRYKMSETLRKEILLEMAAFYSNHETYSKAAGIYEKYIEAYPQDHLLPQILLELGKIYRKIEAYDMAISRFYRIINTSLSISSDQVPFYQELTREAQFEIAETFFGNGKYYEALQFYVRLKRRELPLGEKELIDFRSIYCEYNLGQLDAVLKDLHVFLDTYPESDLIPEVYFLLSHTYRRLNKAQKAVEYVKKLLNESREKNDKSHEVWAYWQRTTANQIANKFYEQKDFMNALKVYQAMASLDISPNWQWPIVYQIGLCFEQLGMYPKAKEAYRLIISEDEWKSTPFTKTNYLSSIQEMATWRLKHLEWLNDSDARLQKLLGSQPL